jgi:rSAM/selenodomain-associated transferase 2
MKSLTIVIPVINESAHIVATLTHVQALIQASAQHRIHVIVVDGGSTDNTANLAAPLCDRVLHSPAGRAAQMNAGAHASDTDALLFLHADTTLPIDAFTSLFAALNHAAWGRFDVRIEGQSRALPMIAFLMNLRSRLSGIATGDQAIFVQRTLLNDLGGYDLIPLMEDIALCKRLKKFGPPACLRSRVTTSGRRWERHGVWRTIWLMWSLRLRYALGADPAALAQRYRAPIKHG